jgi:hypothetical protein
VPVPETVIKRIAARAVADMPMMKCDLSRLRDWAASPEAALPEPENASFYKGRTK